MLLAAGQLLHRQGTVCVGKELTGCPFIHACWSVRLESVCLSAVCRSDVCLSVCLLPVYCLLFSVICLSVYLLSLCLLSVFWSFYVKWRACLCICFYPFPTYLLRYTYAHSLRLPLGSIYLPTYLYLFLPPTPRLLPTYTYLPTPYTTILPTYLHGCLPTYLPTYYLHT